MYAQLVYCLQQVLSGDSAAIAKIPPAELAKVLGATLTGMGVDQFGANVQAWLETAHDPRWQRVPPEQVVGTAGGTRYGYDGDGRPFLTKDPKLLPNDNHAAKPEEPRAWIVISMKNDWKQILL